MEEMCNSTQSQLYQFYPDLKQQMTAQDVNAILVVTNKVVNLIIPISHIKSFLISFYHRAVCFEVTLISRLISPTRFLLSEK
jgi:hypothetical protein